MIKKEEIETILNKAVFAPSGDNSQPWRFEVKNNEIRIFSLSEKDNPIFNFRSRGTLVAHGALLENIIIASSNFGYDAKFQIFPEPQNLNLTIRVFLEESPKKQDSLFSSITTRATNRKKYASSPLIPGDKEKILEAAHEAGGQVLLAEKKEDMESLGKAVSINEIIMLTHEELHKYFFGDIVWSEDEEKRKRCGLYLKTMELAPPQVAIFKLLSNWRRAKILNLLGLPRFIAKENSKIYSSGSAHGIIAVEDNDTEFIGAGRIMQRVWLKATELGLSFHLITGVLYLAQRVNAGQEKMLLPWHIPLIVRAYGEIEKIFGVNGKTIAILFRIGKGGEPSGRSSRLPPVIKYLT